LEPRGDKAQGQSTLNCTLVFWSWAFGARVCWLTASLKACVCTDGLRPGRNCYPAAARGAGNRLELEARALILLPRWFPSRCISKARVVCWIVRKQDHRALAYLYSLSDSLHISSLIRNSPSSKDSSEKASSRLVNKRKIMLPQTRVTPATISAMPRVVIFPSLKTHFRPLCKANWSEKIAAPRPSSGGLYLARIVTVE
jgi:hypothetical protein